MLQPEAMNRRDFFHWGLSGLGATAALYLLSPQRASGALDPQTPPFPNFTPRARRAIHIFLVGGLSHLDSFDPKPMLRRHHGQPIPGGERPDIFSGQAGLLRASDWPFERRGQSGLWVSSLFPHLAQVADELTVIRSMVSDSANHIPAMFLASSGFQFNGFPSMGSWISYGLGNESDSLPTFVVMPDGRGVPSGGPSNWNNGFLPAEHQGIVLRGGDQPVSDLFPARPTPPGSDAAIRAFLDQVNRDHAARLGDDGALLARMRSYELAARMQVSVPRVSRLDDEPEHIRALYGVDRPQTHEFASRCLLARRLLEQGVRFVQLYSGGPLGGKPRGSWDAHENVIANHAAEALRIDQPVAALIQDLKQRGMLEDTLVLFTTEFGRTPFTQSPPDQLGAGRDHNPEAFTVWMAGAGLRPGIAYGATDDLGWKSVQNVVTWHDLHATILHLLGIDHEKLTYYHNGIRRRLTNVHGHVIRPILA